jgi:hypothetical protein
LTSRSKQFVPMALGMLDVLNASAALRFANGKGLRSENPSMMGCNGNRILGDRRNRRACGRVHLCTDSYETQRGGSTHTQRVRYK